MAFRTFVAVASGESLTEQDIAVLKQWRDSGKVRGVICANRAFEAVPWADYLVGCDRYFWETYKAASVFKGGKFAPKAIKGVLRFVPDDYLCGENSGLYALKVLRELGAERIILLGYDMKGGHFHPPHRGKNPAQSDFARYIEQFEKFSGCDIINCTRDSALECFPKIPLEEAIA